MKERPIIFSTDMVKAILEGRKTQTRRVIKPQPTCQCDKPNWQGQIIDWIGYKYEGRQGWFCHACGNGLKHIDEFSAHGIICPYGQVGDRLWVRENWSIHWVGLDDEGTELRVYYSGSGGDYKTVSKDKEEMVYMHSSGRPSIHMPRWASRITLEITELRAERLQEITEADCIAEGIDQNVPWGFSDGYINSFGWLWDSLNAKRGYGWEVNPWVWVISFKL